MVFPASFARIFSLSPFRLFGTSNTAKMLNSKHMEILSQGVDVWNRERKNGNILIPSLNDARLSGSDFTGADLNGAHLNRAHLTRSVLSFADLSEANLNRTYLREAVLRDANMADVSLIKAQLQRADLRGCNLCIANLRSAVFAKANLISAFLIRSNLSEANLSEANLSEADLTGANLSNANLMDADLRGAFFYAANMAFADLRMAKLIDVALDGANLTGVKLWGAQRDGWSINDVICEYAYFDREGMVKTEFMPGEFDCLYSEKMKIVLYYQDDISQFEITTLPALIKLLENKHTGSSLHLKSIQKDAGGVSVSIVVDESGDAKISELQESSQELQKLISELKDEQQLKCHFESQVQILKELIKEKMGDYYQFMAPVNGPVGRQIGTTYNQTVSQNDLSAISKLIFEILAARPEIEKVFLSNKMAEYDCAIQEIQAQIVAPQQDFSKLQKAWTNIKNVLKEAVSLGANCTTILTAMNNILNNLPHG